MGGVVQALHRWDGPHTHGRPTLCPALTLPRPRNRFTVGATAQCQRFSPDACDNSAVGQLYFGWVFGTYRYTHAILCVWLLASTRGAAQLLV